MPGDTQKRPRVFDVDQMARETLESARKRFASTGPHQVQGVGDEAHLLGRSVEESDLSDEGDEGNGSSESEDGTSDGSSEGTESASGGLFPESYSVTLQHSPSRPVTALCVDRSGERLVTGGSDCAVAIWDFQHPDRPYRTLQPCGAHQLRQLDFGDRNDFFLVVAACAQAKVLERAGKECLECVKGDQYLVDMAKTKGHVSALNGGQWSPAKKEEFMTYGQDSTIRLWNVDNAKLCNASIIKVKPLPGVAGRRHASVQAGIYSRCANTIYASAEDGGMYGWDLRHSLITPSMKQRSDRWEYLALSYCGKLLAARSLENIRLFDVRNHKTHVSEWNCEVQWPCDVTFSPDDQQLVFGGDQGIHAVSAKSNDTDEACLVWRTASAPVRRVTWHPRIYQIFAGTHSGAVEAICDASGAGRSQRGILLGRPADGDDPQRKQAKTSKREFYSNEFIINPLALPMFRQEKVRNLSLLRVRQRNAAARSRRPELPISGAGENGRIGQHGSTLSSYIIKNIALQHVSNTKEDPREELLKYSEMAEKEPYWVAPAYAKTQPKPIFREDPVDKKKE